MVLHRDGCVRGSCRKDANGILGKLAHKTLVLERYLDRCGQRMVEFRFGFGQSDIEAEEMC